MQIDTKLKKSLGKFYTTRNPFVGEAWDIFVSLINTEATILEPFAGANYIPGFFPDMKWDSYDILPESEGIVQRDTLKDFPKGYQSCITNPPYLDRQYAKKHDIPYNSEYNDLYLESIDRILENCEYGALIVPATFFGKKKLHKRLWMWDKIDAYLFDDTAKPVGVAYFGPHEKKDVLYFSNGKRVKISEDYRGRYTTYNKRDGNLAASLIDTKVRNIKVMTTEGFNYEKHCHKGARHKVLLRDERITEADIDGINELIEEYRDQTKDFYLSPFKNLMTCGVYRKRMKFIQLSGIITEYVQRKQSKNVQKNTKTN